MSLIPVELEQQVLDFIRSLPPRPRQAFRRAIRNRQREEGDIRALEAELEGFYGLRVQRYRVIFFYHLRGGKRVIRCAYAAPGLLCTKSLRNDYGTCYPNR
jgi:mRNA-degrading endonuclease RelE of RelBE toxin-antitoxin system